MLPRIGVEQPYDIMQDMYFFILALIGACAVFFLWRPKTSARPYIRVIKYFVIAALLLIAFIPFILYFLLGGNPVLDIQSERLDFKGTETRYYQYKDQVYVSEQIGRGTRRNYLPDVDFNSFELGSPVWAKDKNRVYYGDSVIRNADPETFILIEPQIGRDVNAVYIMVKNWGDDRFIRVPELDIEFLEQLGEFYYKDIDTVIYESDQEPEGYKVLLEAHAPTFELVSGAGSRYDPQVARDRDRVWIDGELQTGITPE